jgi:hypothetical protein
MSKIMMACAIALSLLVTNGAVAQSAPSAGATRTVTGPVTCTSASRCYTYVYTYVWVGTGWFLQSIERIDLTEVVQEDFKLDP